MAKIIIFNTKKREYQHLHISLNWKKNGTLMYVNDQCLFTGSFILLKALKINKNLGQVLIQTISHTHTHIHTVTTLSYVDCISI